MNMPTFPKFENTRAYAREQILFHKARILLRRRGVGIVAYALFRLNRTAQTYPRHYPPKQAIYEIKNQVVRMFYLHGYQTVVRRSEQRLTCFRCGGSGIDPYYGDEDGEGEECSKCGGDGLWRVVPLWDFTFRIDGRTYRWHQPSSLVDWDCQATEEGVQKYEAREDKQIIPLRGERARLMMAVCYVYLFAHGVTAIPHHTLRASLYFDLLAYPLHALCLNIQWHKQRFDDWLFGIRLAIADRLGRRDAYDQECEVAWDDHMNDLERDWEQEQAARDYAQEGDPDDLPF